MVAAVGSKSTTAKNLLFNTASRVDKNDVDSLLNKLRGERAVKKIAFVASESVRQVAEQNAKRYQDRLEDVEENLSQVQAQLDVLEQQVALGTPRPSSVDAPLLARSGARPPPVIGSSRAPPLAPRESVMSASGPLVHAVTLDLASIPVFTGESKNVSVEHFLKAFSFCL
jgi:hypothetical protein